VKSKKQTKNYWWHNRVFWTVKGLVDILLAYAFGSWALDTGRWWYYIATVAFTLLGIWFIGRAIKNDRK
jgi:hypothetical protein